MTILEAVTTGFLSLFAIGAIVAALVYFTGEDDDREVNSWKC